jgi:hypothetical protein
MFGRNLDVCGVIEGGGVVDYGEVDDVVVESSEMYGVVFGDVVEAPVYFSLDVGEGHGAVGGVVVGHDEGLLLSNLKL